MHRLLALLAVLASCSSAAPCEGDGCIDAPASAWRLGTPLPRAVREPGVTLFGEQVTVAGGFDASGAVTAEVDAYDIAELRWRSLPDAPLASAATQLAVIGPTLYLAGGLDATGAARGELFGLDPIDHTWKQLTSMDPGTERGAAGVATGPGRFYLVGGATATGVLASCLEYVAAGDLWLPLPPLPVARRRPAVMRRADGSLIVAGGFASLDDSQPLGDVWVLPPPGAVPREWAQRTPMRMPADPELRGGCASGVVLGQLICAGGRAGATAHRVVDSYDPYGDVWSTVEAMPIDRGGTQGAAAGGRLFIPGGTGADAAPTDTLYVFSPLDTAR